MKFTSKLLLTCALWNLCTCDKFMLKALSPFNSTLNDTLLTSYWEFQGMSFTYLSEQIWPTFFTLNDTILVSQLSINGEIDEAAQQYQYNEYTLLGLGSQPPGDNWQTGYGLFHDLLTFNNHFWNWYACFNIGTEKSKQFPAIVYYDSIFDADWSRCTPVLLQKFVSPTPE